tara:strand:+ start:345 stop:725 length:381 start_codon:yes stop_codon:yes gene_type:complete
LKKLIKISELSYLLNLVDPKTKKPLNHIVRFWEKEFSQIKPKIINNQRYFDEKNVQIFKLIRFLIKEKGLRIKGVKNVLNSGINKLDDYNSDSLKAEYYKNSLKIQSKKILEKILKLKNYGKKNTH